PSYRVTHRLAERRTGCRFSAGPAVAEGVRDSNREANMNATTTAPIANRSGSINLKTCGAIARLLITAASLAACGPATGEIQADGGISSTADSGTSITADGGASTNAMDSAPAKPDAGGAADATTSHPADGGSSQPPPPNQTCTIGAQCPNGFC